MNALERQITALETKLAADIKVLVRTTAKKMLQVGLEAFEEEAPEAPAPEVTGEIQARNGRFWLVLSNGRSYTSKRRRELVARAVHLGIPVE